MKSNLLKKHAKSFYWASFFLSNELLINVPLYIIFVEH